MRRSAVAIASMLTAMLAMASVDALGKWLVEADYPVSQILAVRSWVMTAVLVAALPWVGGLQALATQRSTGHMLRLIVGLGGPWFVFLALKTMPLADVMIAVFGAPLIVTAVSAPLFKEKVSVNSWCSVFLGFAGMLLALRPNGMDLQSGAIFALLACVCYACLNITGRWLGSSEPTYRIVFYFSAGSAIATSVFFPSWKPMPAIDVGLMAAMGIFAMIGHLCMTKAFNSAPLGVIAPFEYSAFVWATLFGFLFWDDVPSASVLVGASIIVGSNLYLVRLHSPRMPSPMSGADRDKLLAATTKPNAVPAMTTSRNTTGEMGP